MQTTEVSPHHTHQSCLYEPCFVPRGTVTLGQEKAFSKLLALSWKHIININTITYKDKNKMSLYVIVLMLHFTGTTGPKIIKISSDLYHFSPKHAGHHLICW